MPAQIPEATAKGMVTGALATDATTSVPLTTAPATVPVPTATMVLVGVDSVVPVSCLDSSLLLGVVTENGI